MLDPLASSPFAEDNLTTPPWPTTPHTPGSPIPNLRRSTSSRPQTPAPTSPSANQFGKEPQIYGQPDSGLISPVANTGKNGKNYEKLEPYLRARITMLDRNRRDILVRFDAQTNLSNFTGTTYRNISRSYGEFQQFYDSIVHTNPQTIVPALPLAQTSAPTDEEDDRLVKIMLQRWLTRVCEDPFLMRDEDTRSFIESDFGYQPTPRPSRKKGGSGFSLLKRGVPDEDERLQRARFELTKLEGQFFDAAKAVDKLARVRKGMSTAEAELGNKLISVASTEGHPPLANALRKFGRTWHSMSDIDQATAISECVIIGDTLGYQGMNAKSAKETLLQRTSVLEEYQAAVKTSISKRRYMERLKASSSIRPEKVDEALEDLEEANKYEQILNQRVDGISQNLHMAFGRHEKIVEDDITAALIEHARSMISYERQRLRELEALRPDFANSNSKYVPPVAANRPVFIPKLEDDRKPAPPPTARVAAPQNGVPTNAPTRPFSPAVLPSSVGPAPPSKPSLPFQSPGAGPSTPTSPSLPRFGTPTSPSPAPSAGPPLGGRFMDGSKSMFMTPSSTLAAVSGAPQNISRADPLSASVRPSSTAVSPGLPLPVQATAVSPAPRPAPATSAAASNLVSRSPAPTSRPSSASAFTTALPPSPGTPQYNETDPLGPLGATAPARRAATLSASAFSPLGPGPQLNGHAGHASPLQSPREDVDPLGLARPGYLSQSLRLPPKPQRPRLDAREAASKLANF